MSLCFICNEKLQSEFTRVCSSITPHSNTPYTEKIAEMLGEEFVVIVTPNDLMCMKCTSLLNYLDKCNNDANLVTNTMVSCIKSKYGILPPDQTVQGVQIVNGCLMTHEQLEQDLCKVSNGVTAEVSSTSTTNDVVTPIKTPSILSKPQQQKQKTNNKIKAYKCSFCAFNSKDLRNVRFHMRVHTNKKKTKSLILNQAAANTLTQVQQQTKLFFKCQICSKTFDSRINCLGHIKNEHNISTTSTSNEARETEEYSDVDCIILTENPGNEKECESAKERADQTLDRIKKEVFESNADV